jgi:hypothetical protein
MWVSLRHFSFTYILNLTVRPGHREGTEVQKYSTLYVVFVIPILRGGLFMYRYY